MFDSCIKNKLDMILYLSHVKCQMSYCGEFCGIFSMNEKREALENDDIGKLVELQIKQDTEIEHPSSKNPIPAIHYCAALNALSSLVYFHHQSNSNLHPMSIEGLLPLHYAFKYASLECIYYILQNTEREKIESILQDELNTIMDIDIDKSLLFYAAQSGNLEIFEIFGKYDFDFYEFAKSKPKITQSVINLLVLSRSIDSLVYFIKAITQQRNQSHIDRNPLIIAIQSYQSLDTIKLLAEVCDVNFIDQAPSIKRNVFQVACYCKNPDAAELLLEKINRIETKETEKAIVSLLCLGSPKVTQLALSRFSGSIDIRELYNSSYVLTEDSERSAEMLKAFLDKFPDIINKQPTGQSLLEIYVKNMITNYHVIKFLIENGAKVEPSLMDHFKKKPKLIKMMKEFPDIFKQK